MQLAILPNLVKSFLLLICQFQFQIQLILCHSKLKQ